MNTEVNNQEEVQSNEWDAWCNKFDELMEEARNKKLYAPDVLFVLQRYCYQIQHRLNHVLFTHEHKTQEGE